MSTTHWSDRLVTMHACADAVAWARTQPDLATAWAACVRGDWLLWLAGRLGIDRRAVVGAAAACARRALRFVPAGESRPEAAVALAERWAAGEPVSREELRAAATAAAAVAAFAAFVGYAAAVAADYAFVAAEAARAAAAADADDADDAARRDERKAQAALVRERIPVAMIVAAWEAR